MSIEDWIMRIAFEYGPLGSAAIMVAAGFGLGAALAGSAWVCVQSEADLNAARVEALEDYISKTRLTAAERIALARLSDPRFRTHGISMTASDSDTIRGLLERLGGER